MSINQTLNQYVVKRENKSLVLQLVNESAPVSRAAIAKSTGLNKSTVSSLVNELLADQLVYEAGAGESRGGRKPVMLYFNELAGFTVSIDVGVNYLLGVLTDLNGNIVKEEKRELPLLPFERMEKEIFSMIDRLVASAPISAYGIVGIGIGVPGSVNRQGTVLSAPHLNWENVDLKNILKDRYPFPITIENEAKAGVYGEKRFGAGRSHHNIIYVSIGIGIGVGLILDDTLYHGRDGFAGELGHMAIKTVGEKCRCGSVGCWELYASEQALIRKGHDITLDGLIKRASIGEEEAIRLFEETGDYIGIGITTIINTFNPEQIIIGNRLADGRQWLEPAVTSRVHNPNLLFLQHDAKISFSGLSTYSTVLGMTAFTIEHFLTLKAIQ